MYRIHKDNLIVNITFAWEHAVAIVKPEDEGLLVSHRFPEYSFNEGQIPGFYKYLIFRPYFKNQLSLASPGGAGRNRVLNKTQFKEIIVTVPCEEEQRKIADFLSSVDKVIAACEAEVQNLETQKKAVMKKIFTQEVAPLTIYQGYPDRPDHCCWKAGGSDLSMRFHLKLHIDALPPGFMYYRYSISDSFFPEKEQDSLCRKSRMLSDHLTR